MQPDRPQPVLDARSAPVAFALRNIADRKARGRLRAAATVEAIGKGELEWTDAEGWRYQLEAPPRVTISPKDNERAAATVDLKVWDAGNNLIFRDRIHAWDGFPVLVPDGTEHEEVRDDGTTHRVDNFRESPVEAARLDLAHTVRVVVKNGPWVKDKPGTVSTFYGITGDGRVTSNNATYSTARTGGTLASNTTVLDVGQYTPTGYYCLESFCAFDTSSIPDADAIYQVNLNLWLDWDLSDTDFTVQVHPKVWTSGGLTTADWVSGADIGALTQLATLDTSSMGAEGAYKTFTENGTEFRSAINLTGNTELLLTSSRHQAGDVPTGDEMVRFEDADNAGTTKDPKLVVTHAAASAPFRRALLGVGF